MKHIALVSLLILCSHFAFAVGGRPGCAGNVLDASATIAMGVAGALQHAFSSHYGSLGHTDDDDGKNKEEAETKDEAVETESNEDEELDAQIQGYIDNPLVPGTANRIVELLTHKKTRTEAQRTALIEALIGIDGQGGIVRASNDSLRGEAALAIIVLLRSHALGVEGIALGPMGTGIVLPEQVYNELINTLLGVNGHDGLINDEDWRVNTLAWEALETLVSNHPVEEEIDIRLVNTLLGVLRENGSTEPVRGGNRVREDAWEAIRTLLTRYRGAENESYTQLVDALLATWSRTQNVTKKLLIICRWLANKNIHTTEDQRAQFIETLRKQHDSLFYRSWGSRPSGVLAFHTNAQQLAEILGQDAASTDAILEAFTYALIPGFKPDRTE